MTWTKATDDCWILGTPHDPEASVVREGRAFVAAVYLSRAAPSGGYAVEVGRYATVEGAMVACLRRVEFLLKDHHEVGAALQNAAREAVRLRRGE